MRNSKVALVALLAVLTTSTSSPAARTGDESRGRTAAATTCPAVTVRCDDTGLPDHPIDFVATISGGDPAVTPTFKWTVPGFRILSGQGTSAITVEPPAHGGTVEATVVVEGYNPNCVVKASCTTNIIADPLRRKIDEYGDISVGDEKQRLNIFNDELQKHPSAQGYLVCYGGRRSRANEAQRRCDRVL